MHGIVKPYDIILSTTSKEWHQMANVVDQIDDQTIDPLLFDIIEGETYVKVSGIDIKVPNRKTLVADLRPRSNDTTSPFYLEHGDNLIPMHSPKESYQPISNRDLWEALKKAINDTGARVVTAGTLHACAKFFVSVDIGQAESKVNGDDFMSYLNFLTSHDGIYASQAYDSMTRIVCHNTLIWSLSNSGDLEYKVYHTKNAPAAIENFSQMLNAVLLGRINFKTQMEYLASVGITFDQALFLALAFLADGQKFASHKAYNMAEEIQNAFKNGMGNQGKTLYDLFNGFTETYTHGSGVGKKSTTEAKLYKSNFGTASERKQKFTNHLLGMNITEELQKGEILAFDYAKKYR